MRHPTKERFTRLLTPIEHARAKGLPEGWIQSTGLSTSRAHEALGQSVIFSMFVAVGRAIAMNLKQTARLALIGTGGAEIASDKLLLAA